MKTTHYVIFLLLLTVFSCRKDSESETTTITEVPGPVIVGYQPDVEKVNAAVEGFVQDHLGAPLTNAEVTFGNSTILTDDLGYFKQPSTLLNKFGEMVTVEHPGFFKTIYRFYPSENSNNWLKFKLVEKVYNQVSGFSGGTITIPGGGFLNIPPKGLMTLADTLHLGPADVAVSYIDVNQPGELYRGAGNHFGVSQTLDNMVVNSYGSLAIEVLTANGEPLKVVENDSLKPIVELPISPLVISGPSTATLWNFHETYGAWVEGSAADKVGNNYRIRLDYFNYINIGIGYTAAYFEGQFVDLNNSPYTHSFSSIRVDDLSLGYDVVDELGFFSGFYPEGRPYDLSLYDLCTQLSSSQMPSSSGVLNVGSMILPVAQTKIVANVTCNGTPVNDYVLNLSTVANNYYYATFSNDTLTLPVCLNAQSSQIMITDPVTLLSKTFLINPDTLNNIGNVELCNTGPTDYIQFTYVLTPFFNQSPAVISQPGFTSIDLNSGYLEFYSDAVGIYNGNNAFLYDTPNFYLTGSLDTLLVTTYTNTSLIGTFKGTVYDTVSTNFIPIDGDFNIEL